MSKHKVERPATMSCHWCGVTFTPVRYDARFCSGGCRDAWGNAQLRHECGPCPGCGEMFRSKYKGKKYCTHACYVSSPEFVARREANLARINPTMGVPRVCQQCGGEYPRSRKTKFCKSACRRQYFAERFDRWVASPETVALPQNFDEFLTRDELSCPVAGCEWEGGDLGRHVNLFHGITAREFKKLCGFNLRTGLVGMATHRVYSDRARKLIAEGVFKPGAYPLPHGAAPADGSRYVSLESKEHALKSRADSAPLRDVWVPCRWCGVEVQQPMFGQRLYCSLRCRGQHYQRSGEYLLKCGQCVSEFRGTRSQWLREKKGLPVCCSMDCRYRMNIAAALAARGRSMKVVTPAEPAAPPVDPS